MATILGTVNGTGELIQRRGEEIIRQWPTAHTVPFASVLAELGNYGLDTTAARQLASPDAFVRAVKATVKRRAAAVGAQNPDEDILLRKVPAKDVAHICYQFTHEFKVMGNVAALGYAPDAMICFDKTTGIVTSSDKQLESDIQAAIPQFQASMTFTDVNRLMEKLLERALGSLAVTRIADGVLYVPEMTVNGVSARGIVDRLALFTIAVGGWLIRRPDIQIIPAPVVGSSGAPVVVPPTNTPVPAPLPSAPVGGATGSGDTVADSYHNSLVARLFEIEEKVLKYQTTSYKHAKRAESAERSLRDELAGAMAEIDVLGREGLLGVWWEKMYDYRAGVEFLLNNPQTALPAAPVATVDPKDIDPMFWARGYGYSLIKREPEPLPYDTAVMVDPWDYIVHSPTETSNVTDWRDGMFVEYHYSAPVV